MPKATVEISLQQASIALSDFVNVQNEGGQSWLRQILYKPTLLHTALMTHRPEFFTAKFIRGSFIPFASNAQHTRITCAADVDHMQAQADAPNDQWYWFKPRNFHRMLPDQQHTELVSMILGYNWDVLRDNLYQSDKAFLNQAVILGFMCRSLLFANNIEEQFKKLWIQYKTVVEQGLQSAEHKAWLSALQQDEYSSHYQCKQDCMYYGTAIAKTQPAFNFYNKYGYPYCCRPQVPTELLITEQLRLQEGIGFTPEYLIEAAELHQMGVSKQFLFNVNMRTRLLHAATQLAKELQKIGMQSIEIDYTINGILHPEFGELRTQVIHKIAMQPFRERIQQEYSSLGDISELLIESNNALSPLGKTSYLDNVLRNMATKSANQVSAINLIRANQDILEYILGGLYYFANISEFMLTLQNLRELSSQHEINIEQVLERIIRLQRIILQRIDVSHKQGWQLTLQERGILMLIPETSRFSLEFLDSLQNLVVQCGINAAMQGYDLATQLDTGFETDKLFKTVYDFTRLCRLEYGEVLSLGTELELADIESLVTLLRMSIDIRKLTNLDSQSLNKFSRILYKDPTAIDLVSESSDPNELQLLLLSKSYGSSRFVDRELAYKYRASASYICQLVESQVLDLTTIPYLPSEPIFWEAINKFSETCKNLRGVLTTKPLLENIAAAVPQEELWIEYNLDELRNSCWINSNQFEKIVGLLNTIAEMIEAYEIRKAPFRLAFVKRLDSLEIQQALQRLDNSLRSRIQSGINSMRYTEVYASQLQQVGHTKLRQVLGLISKQFNYTSTDCFPVDGVWLAHAVEMTLREMSEEDSICLTSHFNFEQGIAWLVNQRVKTEAQVNTGGVSRLLNKYKDFSVEVEW